MNITDELRRKLRQLLDETIPKDGTEEDTRFLGVEIDELLQESKHIYEAAAAGWKIKAARAMSERGGLEESQAGDEKYKFVSLKEYRDHCLAMSRMYAEMVPGSGSKAFKMDAPDPFMKKEGSDLTRLLGVD